MTNTENNLISLTKILNVQISQGLEIFEYSSSVTLINHGKLTRLFPNSNYDISISRDYVTVNNINVLSITKEIKNIKKRNELLLLVSQAIYDNTELEFK
jgi:hypothetical protein